MEQMIIVEKSASTLVRATLRLIVSPQVRAAVEEYQKRQRRSVHPGGAFDRAGRWLPSESERQPCCGAIRFPSRAFPYSMIKHCRSRDHIIALYRIDRAEFNQAMRLYKGGETDGTQVERESSSLGSDQGRKDDDRGDEAARLEAAQGNGALPRRPGEDQVVDQERETGYRETEAV